MSADELVYRDFRPGDEIQLRKLYFQVFNRERSIQEWRWEFMNSPVEPSTIRVIEHDNDIVGHIGLIPFPFRYFDEDVVFGKSEDTSLNSDFRGKKLFGKLERQCLKTAATKGYRAAFSISRTAKEVHIKAGYRPLVPMKGYFAPLRPNRVARELRNGGVISRTQAWLGKPLLEFLARRFSKRVSEHKAATGGIAIERMTQFSDEFDDLWNRFSAQNKIITIKRSSTFLDWRFTQKPGQHYEIYGARHQGELVGYLICTAITRKEYFNVGLRIGVTSDYLVLGSHRAALAPLLLSAANYWVTTDCDCVINWVQPRSLYASEMTTQLKAIGLVSMFGKYSIPLSVQMLQDGASDEEILEDRNWFFTLAFCGRWA